MDHDFVLCCVNYDIVLYYTQELLFACNNGIFVLWVDYIADYYSFLIIIGDNYVFKLNQMVDFCGGHNRFMINIWFNYFLRKLVHVS